MANSVAPRTSREFLSRLKDLETDSLACFSNELYDEINAAIAAAVAEDDQSEATALWICRTIGEIQRKFILAFRLLKGEKFFEAWCTFEQCEIQLKFLRKHHPSDEHDDYLLNYMERMVERWQGMYSYKIFFSPEFLKKKITCSVCGNQVKPRTPCGHIVGDIYNGEMCFHRVDECDILSISAVENPVQKYSVAFLTGEDGNKVDHYNYSNINFIVARLASPFHEWSKEVTTRVIDRSDVAHLSEAVPCPCLSGRPFGDCCSSQEKITVPHLDVRFAVSPPASLPEIETMY
jgi:hypothetical protein